MRRALPTLALLLACRGPGKIVDSGAPGPPTPRPAAWPFPNAELIDSTGHVALPADLPAAATPLPTQHVAWRTGFSPAQTTVFRFGDWIDPASLPGPDDLALAGSVQLWDLTTGDRHPAWAELDAWPDNPDPPVLLVRPAAPLPVGHRIAAVVGTGVRTRDGDPLPVADWYGHLLAGEEPPGLEGRAAHYQELDATLDALGAPPRVVAVDFPIGDPTAPVRHIAARVGAPVAHTIDKRLDADAHDLPAQTWRRLEGTFTTDSWLEDDLAFDLDADGIPADQGHVEAELYVHVPASVRDAAPGTAPVWLFGHGIFASPAAYMSMDDDPSGVLDLADRAGAIVVATTWRGLTSSDLLTAVNVGNDFGRLPELTDKLAQGVANNIALSRLVLEGDLLDDPDLEGKADPAALWYYGISLGGIEGAVMFANQDRIRHGVLHVGGAAWSTMLERSSNWAQFEPLVADGVPDPADRQLLFAVSQLFWDPADPASYTDDLRDKQLLWQVALHDEQVPNRTTELLARGVGLTAASPTPRDAWGIPSTALPIDAPALTWFDPEAEPPPEANRPSPVTRAHSDPRLWDGAKLQTIRFLQADDPGVIEHFCGDAPCSATNPGGPGE